MNTKKLLNRMSGIVKCTAVAVIGAAAAFASGEAGAATCTYDGSWDTTPSSAEDEIVIVSGDLTWGTSLPPKVKSWTQTGGTVTIGTTFDPDVFPFLEVTGDITFTEGTWKHKGNGSASMGSVANKYRLYVKCGGSMTIGASAVITADSLGYESHQPVNGHKDSGTQGGSYGGHGGMATAKETWTYGSFFAPEELGNCGNWSGKLYGGGSVRLDVAGALSHAGRITVDSYPAASHYAGAGGSIFIHAGSISGTGALTADSASTQIGGSGGRIAVILTGTGADFSQFDIFNQASAIQKQLAANEGACGTIYAETKADGDRHGWLIVKGNGKEPTDKGGAYYADPFSFEMTSARLSKITVAGYTKLALREGYTLDISDAVIDERVPGYGLYLCGGELVSDKPVSVKYTIDCRTSSTIDIDDLTIASAGVLRGIVQFSLPGDLTIASGGKMTTDGAASIPKHRLDVVVAGNMTIAAGATVDVTGCGYSMGSCPNGSCPISQSGGSHGGQGVAIKGVLNGIAPYGSATDPLTHGAGGGSGSPHGSNGGGVVRLQVGGKLTVDGSILANGVDHTYYLGAGGSVNITAGSLVGAAGGVIEASGGYASQNVTASGGGRVAVRLTGVGDFSSFLGTIGAFSDGNSGKSMYGGAGTVYLQTASQGEGGGTLIIDNGGAKSVYKHGLTPIGGNVDGTSFGDVIIRNNAVMTLADNATLTVKGDFRNESKFVAGAGSSVIFAGTGVSTVSGDSAFVNLGSQTDGKTIRFTAGSTQTVTGALSVDGGENKVTLCSTEEGKSWGLDTSAGLATLSGVAIGDCLSVASITVTDGENLGGNQNVTIQNIEPATVTWSGAVDGVWENAANWDLRVPTKVDTVVLPFGTRQATLSANTKVAALTVAGVLDVSDKGITVAGDLSVSGSLVASGTAPIFVGGNLFATGAFTPANSVVTMNGASAQAVVCGDAFAFAALVVSAPSASFSGRLTCAALTLGKGEFVFADGMTVSATSFTVNGSDETPDVTLRAASEGGVWYLKTSISSVTGVSVAGSDASGGVAIVPACSQGVGDRNVNWLFNDTRKRWTGAVDTDFAKSGNWEGDVAPTAADAVVIEGDHEVVVSAPTAVAGLTLGLGATVRVNAAMTVGGSVAVEPQGTLVANRPMTIAGNLAVVDGGALTHDDNSGTVTNKVELTVAGTAYFAEGASISVKGKGFVVGKNRGPGSINPTGESSAGASYGGRGWHGATGCYGSIVNPVDVGSAGGWEGSGGGAVILRVKGQLTLDAEINADGSAAMSRGFYSGSGGAVNIIAGSLLGKGSIRAHGGALSQNLAGGGGRIAVVLTDEKSTFASFAGTFSAYGGISGYTVWGSSGTVYTKTAGDENGTLRIYNAAQVVGGDDYSKYDRTDFPATKDNDPFEAKGLNVIVSSHGTLSLTADADISALSVLSSARVLLNGYQLRVHQRKPKDKAVFDDSRVDRSAGGDIVWNVPGFMLIVR